jgi:hypothetical protein
MIKQAVIVNKGIRIKAQLRIENGSLALDMDGYFLKNTVSLNQHWEISDQSLKEFGNKFDFDLTGVDPNEITNFELAFVLDLFLPGQKIPPAGEFVLSISYTVLDQEICLNNHHEKISIREAYLEDVFRQLDKILSASDRSPRSCFGCTLSGYEKGGSGLFCLKKSREEFLSKTYLDQYCGHFMGLEKELVTEFYYCDQFEEDIYKSK